MFVCDLVASEFRLQSLYYVHFRIDSLGKRMDYFTPKDGFGIK